ncbi:four helix bundle protein [Candidatus Peregrinibacteria bacterium]|nr:four helix bundle protein [Candidatus Peregrinibacteria bacterium]
MIGTIIHSHKDLIVWQKAMDLVVLIYKITENFPKTEIYGITSQMRRSAVSIPSNIAEGRKRGSKADYRQFLLIAYGSGAELETQLEICQRLSYIDEAHWKPVYLLLEEVMRMLNSMITGLQEFPKKLRSYKLRS